MVTGSAWNTVEIGSGPQLVGLDSTNGIEKEAFICIILAVRMEVRSKCKLYSR